MANEWLQKKFSELSVHNSRIQTLNEIKKQLLNMPSVDTNLSTALLTSNEIYSCLEQSTESEEAKLAYEILMICFPTLNIDSSNIHLLYRPLQHHNPSVCAAALDKILQIMEKNPSINDFDDGLTLHVIYCLNHPETTVGTKVVNILSRLLISNYGNNEIKTNFLKKLEGKDIVRCRVYEIAINMAKSSSSILRTVESILDKCLTELNNEDVLLQLSILELLVSLAEQNHGLIYLESRHVFDEISRRVEQLNENPTDTFLIPGFMKFFGKIAYSQPEKIILEYPHMINCLFDCLLSCDITILPVAFDTLGNLAHSSKGKILLEANYPQQLKACFEGFHGYLCNLPTELKTRFFNALEYVFSVEGEITNEISNITRTWCQHLMESNHLQFLFEFCKNPFPDIKISSLSFVKILCKHNWGILALKNTGGFIEYLLDRRVEFDKDVRLVKYEIICILAESTLFDTLTHQQLEKYVNEGVHYVEGIVEVAVDGT